MTTTKNITYEQSIDHLEKYFPGKAQSTLQSFVTAPSLFTKCDYAYSHGIIIADTKFEFGLDENGNIVIGDEC